MLDREPVTDQSRDAPKVSQTVNECILLCLGTGAEMTQR